MLQLPPLSLYVHIPWCIKKCPYCDFNSHAAGNTLPESEYISHLLLDLEGELPAVYDREVRSIFIGGGTPSLLSPPAVARLLQGIHDCARVSANAEITLEANPGTFEQQKFCGFRAAGVNRLSIGIQSFHDASLKALGRVHDGDEARRAVGIASGAGFENVNLDLMHGLPGQTAEEAIADLKTAIEYAPAHISWYELTLEPNTVFYSHPPVLPQEEVMAEMCAAGDELLQQAGFENYEISARSQPGYQCRHNLNYWEFGDYAGIGAGAHGKLTLPREQQVIRYSKKRMPSAYLAASGDNFVAQRTTVSPAELPREFFMNALRLKHGVPAVWFQQRTGLSLSVTGGALYRARESDLMTRETRRLSPTPRGQRFLNDLLGYFV